MKTTQHEIEAYRNTYQIARNTWELASTKAVRTGNPEDLMEARGLPLDGRSPSEHDQRRSGGAVMATEQYPVQLMANIEAANLGAVNHYSVANQVMHFAKADVLRASNLMYSTHIVTRTRYGNLEIKKAGCNQYEVRNLNTRELLHAGTKRTTVEFVAGAYQIEGGQ